MLFLKVGVTFICVFLLVNAIYVYNNATSYINCVRLLKLFMPHLRTHGYGPTSNSVALYHSFQLDYQFRLTF